MTDLNDLKRKAEAAADEFGAYDPSEAEIEFMSAITPALVLELFAENERLVAQLCVCPSCHGQGEVYTGRNTWEGHFQPPEPIMETCGECGGDGSIGDADDLSSLLAERDQLRAEVEALRAVMGRVSRWINTLPAGTHAATTIGQAIDAAMGKGGRADG